MGPKPKKSSLASDRNKQGQKGFAKAATAVAAVPELPRPAVLIESFNQTKVLGKATYGTGSQRTNERRASEQRKLVVAAGGSRTIESLFARATKEPTEPLAEPVIEPVIEDVIPLPPKNMKLPEAITKIQLESQYIKSAVSNKGVSSYEKHRLFTTKKFLQRLHRGESSMKASKTLSDQLWAKGPYQAMKIRQWGGEYLRKGKLDVHSQGKHTKCTVLKDDEDFSLPCLEWLRSQKSETRSPLALKAFAENNARLVNEERVGRGAAGCFRGECLGG